MSIFTRTSKLDALRKGNFSLAKLPDTVSIPPLQGSRDAAVKPIEMVTLDDIAFALLELQEKSRAIYREADALRALYDLAREHGAVGADVAMDAVPVEKGGAK